MPADLPWRMHAYGGSIPTRELYNRLKERKVLIVPGEYFFVGQDTDWAHTKECIRFNFARSDKELEAGIPIMAEELKKAYESS